MNNISPDNPYSSHKNYNQKEPMTNKREVKLKPFLYKCPPSPTGDSVKTINNDFCGCPSCGGLIPLKRKGLKALNEAQIIRIIRSNISKRVVKLPHRTIVHIRGYGKTAKIICQTFGVPALPLVDENKVKENLLKADLDFHKMACADEEFMEWLDFMAKAICQACQRGELYEKV